jgi:peptide/nickel transport system substrate-binding protein
MKNKLTAICLMLFVVLLVSVALACDQPATSPATQQPAKATGPQKGGTFRMGVLAGIDTIGYPAKMTRADNEVGSKPAVESLAIYDNSGNMIPWLATEWKNDATAKTITVTLRKGVKFHDGTALDADAVKFNWDQAILQKRAELTNLKSVDVIDGSTVRANLVQWDNTIVKSLLVNYGKMCSPTAFNKNGGEAWATLNPVGTGPFKFVSFKRDVDIKYTKNLDYWQTGKPYLDGINIVMFADTTTRLLSLRGGEIDMAEINPQDVKDIQTITNFTIVKLNTGLGAALQSLMADSGHADSPFAKLQVRQAVSYAVDTKAIVNSIYYGQYLTTNQWGIQGNPGFNPAVKGYPYDPAKAKQLLADAGYPNGFKTKYYFQSEFANEATAVQGFLKAVGIDLEMDPMNQGRWSTAGQQGWNGGILRTSNRIDSDMLGQFPKTMSSKPGLYGMSMFVPPEMDDLISKAKAVTDDATKQKMTQEIQRVIFDQYCAFTPMLATTFIHAKSVKVHDDGRVVVEANQWTPADLWMDK